MLTEDEKVVSDEREIVNIFNEYFPKIVPNLDIQHPPNNTLHHDPLLNAIKIFENNPSILQMKKINSLDESKTTQSNDTPTKVVKKL